MDSMLEVRAAIAEGGKLYVLTKEGGMELAKISSQELEPQSLLGFPQQVIDTFMQTMAATSTDTFMDAPTLMDRVRMNLKELRLMADSRRTVRVPIAYHETTLDGLVQACIEGLSIIRKAYSAPDEQYDEMRSIAEAELMMLRSNMNALMGVYAVNPQAREPTFGVLKMSPLCDDIEEFVNEFRNVKTRADMQSAAATLKALLDKHGVDAMTLRAAKNIFIRMYAALSDLSAQALAVDLLPLIQKLPIDVEAHTMKLTLEADVYAVLSSAKDGLTLMEIVDSTGHPKKDVRIFLTDSIKQGELVVQDEKYYTADNAPRRKSSKAKKDKGKGKGKDADDDDGSDDDADDAAGNDGDDGGDGGDDGSLDLIPIEEVKAISGGGK